METRTYTIRVDPKEYRLLGKVAEIYDTTIAELSRRLLSEGIRCMLTPEGIEEYVNAQRSTLLHAIAELQKETLEP